ncbi:MULTISPECIES: 2-keto-4-pentenoate hydratase [unclassified Jeotgalibaca]|uniref:2-keto-4-pentenoate hydratase n=1 Tax=unclassified Jeotgalibaca TaxID=2621505 RepID=UPI003FD49BEF
MDIKDLADHLASAHEKGTGVQPIISIKPDITIDEAYHVQLETIDREVKNGAKITGKKIGLTSVAVQQALGVDEPDYGHLLDNMVIENGGTVPRSALLQAKVEGEIAFILKDELKGPNVTPMEVLQATDYVLPALEIVDSRVADWKITLADTVADNASSGLYVLGGKPVKITDVDLKMVGMNLYKNGHLENTGVGTATLGDPAICVAWLANKLSQYDITLKPGEVILSGALSAMVVAEPGDYFQAKFSDLGEVSVHFEK